MAQPLAERMRPKTLDDYIGQKHLVGEGAVLRRMIDAGRISSFILWGPPGVGREDHVGSNHSQSIRSSFLYAECGHFGSKRSARCYREGS